MAKKLKREELLDLIKYYEQAYFTEDLPIPFKGNLTIYPVLVKDYYRFYSCIGCFKINKNEDINGVGMSHLDYILYLIEQEAEKNEKKTYFQLISLLELIFHIQNGIICPVCGSLILYSEINKKMEEIQKIKDEDERKKAMQEYVSIVETCNCGSDKKSKREPAIHYSRERNNKYIAGKSF